MASLTHRNLTRLLDCVGELYAHHDLDSFPKRVLTLIGKLIPADYALCSEMNLRRNRVATVADIDSVDTALSPDAEACYFRSHPFVQHHLKTGDVSAMRISDFLPRRQYRKTELYHEVFRDLGVEYQLGCGLRSPSPTFIFGLAFVRSRRDFSAEDRLALNLLRPHLFQAYRNAELFAQFRELGAFASQALETARQGVVVLDPQGRVRFRSSNTVPWFAGYFASPGGTMDTLPEELQQWLRSRRLPDRQTGRLPAPREPLVITRSRGRLFVRLAAGARPGEQLLLMEERPAVMSPAPLRKLGLTIREAEVLLWVTQGKTSPDISVILGCRPATVNKHLERILRKLHVETRTAAALRATEALSGALDGESSKLNT